MVRVRRWESLQHARYHLLEFLAPRHMAELLCLLDFLRVLLFGGHFRFCSLPGYDGDCRNTEHRVAVWILDFGFYLYMYVVTYTRCAQHRDFPSRPR